MFRTLLAVSLLSLAMIVSSENAAAPRVKSRNLFCDPCLRIVGGIEGAVEKGEPGLEQLAENICDDTLGHIGDLAQQCKDWVEKDFQKIMDKLNSDWSAESICEDYHLC
ncbi:hypothetical protein PRIPAC_85851 [Pristionchus pacificus]|uniref:Saposin B-type domain-containing protein n=1 Tax=Pristionchus pacificus TaxID=54126 RepID=A0A454XL17_PRIPA|nr:hypothetical protein PRIPAC_85851 [Pristionchus pacificus]|eukprot:PDM75840.1 hypothetical protein PRIPAC_40219 [Pristionchus pacificus]